MAKALTLFFCVTVFPKICAKDILSEVIVWNVGQGLWVTAVHGAECWHFDMGGERINAKKVKQTCGHLHNRLFFSHWDLDHVGFLPQLKHLASSICVAVRPRGTTLHLDRKRWVDGLAVCGVPSKVAWLNPDAKLTAVPHKAQRSHLFERSRGGDRNASHIFMLGKSWLLPGDSPTTDEKLWHRLLPPDHQIRFLILGHHGSRTSTSTELLERLPKLQVGVASARHAKYGHPHSQVLERLRPKGIVPLRTESFGTLRFRVVQF